MSIADCFAVNDKIVVSRSCHFEAENALEDDCLNEKMPSYVKTQYCKTCSMDGCNGDALNPDFDNTYTTDGSENSIDE